MTPDRLAEVQPPHGVAMAGALSRAADPAAMVRQVLAHWNEC